MINEYKIICRICGKSHTHRAYFFKTGSGETKDGQWIGTCNMINGQPKHTPEQIKQAFISGGIFPYKEIYA